MARDRQRAKQRRARRRETVAARPSAERSGAGPLDHGSAGADEAAARLALGAEAAALPTDADKRSRIERAEVGTPADDRPDGIPETEEEPGAGAPALSGHGDGGDSPDRDERDTAGAGPPARRPETSRPAPLRAVGFLRNSWAELQRVQWPDRRQVGQATGVVLLFVIIAGAYLGLADAVAQKIVDTILQ